MTWAGTFLATLLLTDDVSKSVFAADMTGEVRPRGVLTLDGHRLELNQTDAGWRVTTKTGGSYATIEKWPAFCKVPP